MPIICRACQGLLAEDAAFCGFCGFRLAPLVAPAAAPPPAPQAPPAAAAPAPEEPILLTRVKRREPEPAPAASPEPAPRAAPAAEATRPASKTAPRRTVRRSAPTREPFPARAQRFPLKVEVTYNSEHNFYTGFMENIGEGGLFIATHTPGTLGEHVEVTFTVPGLEHDCSVVCRVRWLREYDPLNPDAVPGMGCQFGPLETHVAAAIQAFIEHRDPIFFD